MLVMKFGGSSVADRAQIDKVLGVVRAHQGRRPLVVSSAHKGMTNALIAAGRAAAEGDAAAAEVPIALQQKIADELEVPESVLAPFYDEIRALLRGVSLVRELSPRSLDYISSFGERMAVRALAEYFSHHGLAARAYDVWELGFVTDSQFGRARPLPGFEAAARERYQELAARSEVPIVTGFIGKNERGEITTVGRNGSDLTATLLAVALGAEEVEIWSDTDGVMTADPHLVAGAKNIPVMSFDEAAELAYFGSRMLHPETLLPAMGRDVPVRVLNTNHPEHLGTVIVQHAPSERAALTSVAYKEGQCILTVRTARMFNQVGYLARLFELVSRHGLVVGMVATSEVSVSLSASDEACARRVLQDAAALGECRLDTGKTILAVVGDRLPQTPGIAAELLAALAEVGVNVEMISYGWGSINVSMVIDDREIDRAVKALHGRLFERP